MRSVWRAAAAVLSLVCLIGSRDARAGPPPTAYQEQFSQLSATLAAFEARLDADWDGSVGPGEFAGALSAANGNKSAGLLTLSAWTRITQQLDAYQAMGVEVIKLDVNYPVLTPAFHTFLAANPPLLIPDYSASADWFIGYPASFYNRLASEIRSRGFDLWIEHGTLFADYSPTPPDAYFADMRTAGLTAARARYTAERSAEAVAIATQLRPDYFTVLEEPDTQAMNFGYFPGGVPVFDEAGWQGFVGDVVAAVAAADPAATALLGAGAGVWLPAYVGMFAGMPELDFVDLHIYPLASLTTNFLEDVLDLIDGVRAAGPGKRVMIGEAWAYKTTSAEVSAGLDFNTVFGRDVWSFWEPVDSAMLDVLFKLMHHKGVGGVMPFWAQYYFANLTYGDPDYEGLGPIELVTAAGNAAVPNIASVTLTGTGQRFRDLAAVPRDADGDGVPDVTDGGDSDGDGVADAADACPGYATSWAVPPGDSDCDGFPDSGAAGGLAPESFFPTRRTAACARTPLANDEALADAWPFDLDDNQRANTLDVLRYTGKLNFVDPHPDYTRRLDLNGDGRVNTLDVLKFVLFLNKICVP